MHKDTLAALSQLGLALALKDQIIAEQAAEIERLNASIEQARQAKQEKPAKA